jgi:asparagine synthase (glutamine-hydrolysing)
MPDFIVRELDRSSMAHAVEARVPFLDHELVELCSRIPPQLKMRWFKEKYILRRAMRDLLPAPVLHRPKRGLEAPVDSWFRGPIPESIEDVLSPSALRRNGYFHPAEVAHLLARQRTGHRRFGRQLLGVAAVQLWHRMFVEGRDEISVA